MDSLEHQLNFNTDLPLFQWVESDELKVAVRKVFASHFDLTDDVEHNDDLVYLENKVGASIVGDIFIAFRNIMEETYGPDLQIEHAGYLEIINIHDMVVEAAWDTFNRNLKFIHVVVEEMVNKIRERELSGGNVEDSGDQETLCGGRDNVGATEDSGVHVSMKEVLQPQKLFITKSARPYHWRWAVKIFFWRCFLRQPSVVAEPSLDTTATTQ